MQAVGRMRGDWPTVLINFHIRDKWEVVEEGMGCINYKTTQVNMQYIRKQCVPSVGFISSYHLITR